MIGVTDAVTVALIVAVPTTIASVATLLVAIRSGNRMERKEEEIKNQVHEVHIGINSRMDELVKASKALGRQEERDSRT